MTVPARRRRLIERLDRRIRRLEERSRRFSWGRLAVVVAGSMAVFWAYQAIGANTGMLVLVGFVAAFLVLIRLHDRVEEGLEQTRRARRIMELHEARRRLEWDTLPEARSDADPQRRPFAVDLNLAGPRSIHHLLDGCASRGGSMRLRDWLCDHAPALEEIQARQRLVRELVPLGLFRDHLTRVSMIGRKGDSAPWDDGALREWLGRTEGVPRLKPWLIGLSIFAAVNVALILAHIFGVLPMLWPMTLLIYFAVYFTKYREVKDLFEESQDLDLMFERFVPALEYLEQFRFKPAKEAEHVAAPIRSNPPSIHMKSVRRIAAGAAATRSEFLWLLLNVLMPWNMLFTYLLHRTKSALRQHLPGWLEAWYTLESASSLAAHADYHPQRAFPEIQAAPSAAADVPIAHSAGRAPAAGSPGGGSGAVESDGSPEAPPPPSDVQESRVEAVFEGRGLGHPLLPEPSKVRNDFVLDRLGRVVLITGSNMSGKSTFLRTLGVNLHLAFAGAPVDASAMRTICFRVFTSINVVDSVQEGLSHFYAEVRRLKMLLDALDDNGSIGRLDADRRSDVGNVEGSFDAGNADGSAITASVAHSHASGVVPHPSFNLIDEIFRGTNNRERLIGSRAFIHALAGRRAVSLISTHDLELTGLEEEVPELGNFHFREDVSGERMTFDYTLRPGPSPTTNALKIMARAGLPVDPDGEAEAP